MEGKYHEVRQIVQHFFGYFATLRKHLYMLPMYALIIRHMSRLRI